MKKNVFLLAGTAAAALALAACGSRNDDAVTNAELNQPAAEDLNALANAAAADAAMNAIANTAPVVNADGNAVAPANGPNPSEDEEQNVSGM